MMPPWKYFENLSEIVYVSDPETHELVYLNQYAQDAFGVAGTPDGYGKCYAVLQGMERPCPFCTTPRLKVGKFYEWIYRNPLLDSLFTIKDTLVEYNGKQYRMEFAIRTEQEQVEADHYSVHVHYESVLNEAVLIALSTQNISEALHHLCSGIHCGSMYIYEIRGDLWATTLYAWPPLSQDAAWQSVEIPFTGCIQQWYHLFSENEPVLLPDVAKLRREQPDLCKLFRVNDAQRTILLPLLTDGRVTGLWRIDNPPAEQMERIAAAYKMMSQYLVLAIAQTKRLQSLEEMGYHDQMTGALNRYALSKHLQRPKVAVDTGLVFCDVVGLKRINDRMGHVNGDRMILRVYHALVSVFSYLQVYRIGGDEFLILSEGLSREAFQRQVARLREQCVAGSCPLSIGSAWVAAGGDSLQNLMQLADADMYRDKFQYYQNRSGDEGTPLPAEAPGAAKAESHGPGQSPIRCFLDNYYFDADTFFQSLVQPNTNFYIFCGDMRQNLYYISDNLKEEFNFSENLVYDFVAQLEERIYEPDRAMHEEDMRAMIAGKRETHSIRYRIYDRHGRLVWLHCRGILRWNSDKTEPLFFSGCMNELKNESEVDPVTGLLNQTMVIRRLEGEDLDGLELTMYAIVFRDFADINRTFGRRVGNQVLREIGSRMEQELGGSFRIYRLDGVKLLAVTLAHSDPKAFVETVQRIVQSIYRRFDIHIIYPFAVGVLHSRGKPKSIQELIDNATITARTAKAFPALDYMEFEPHMSQRYQAYTDMSMMLNYSVNHQFQGFRIVVQPQVHAKTGRIFGGEALLRWEYRKETVSPARFIPVLEQTGLIVPVGKWVLEQAVAAGALIRRCRPEFLMSVNVSYLQIMEDGFFDCVQDLLRRYGLPANNLLIELTETHFDEMPDNLKRFILNCRDAGIRFALDDFGSAYSGLQLLMQYPADLIKLDRTLMREITSSEEKKNFIMSVVYACHRFGKKVCVEGVETEEELRTVQETDCDYIQGFYFYRPLELSQLYREIAKPEPPEVLTSCQEVCGDGEADFQKDNAGGLCGAHL